MTKIKWAAIIPLIGGFPIGAEKAIGRLPEYIVSYKAFEKNDSFYLSYLKSKGWRGKYVVVDAVKSAYYKLLPKVDITVCTPPCSGLSMANMASTRGSDSNTNDWIYKSLEFVQTFIKPGVHIIENAPGLYTNTGEGVRQRLIEMVKTNNSSINFYKTNTLLHGIPQKRERTFAFIWENNKAPILPFIKVPRPTMIDYLKEIEPYVSPEDLLSAEQQLITNPDYEYLLSKGLTFEDMQAHPGLSTTGIIITNKWIDDVKQYYLSKGANLYTYNELPRSIENCHLRKWIHIQNKLNEGKGFWDTPIGFFNRKGYYPTVFHRSILSLTHPTEQRMLTLREDAHLMGLPNDYDLTDVTPGILGQNVPTYTAQDIINLAIPYLTNNNLSDYSYVKQNNSTDSTDLKELLYSSSIRLL